MLEHNGFSVSQTASNNVLHVEAYLKHLNLHLPGNTRELKKDSVSTNKLQKNILKIPKILLSSEQLALLVAGSMWTSFSSHTCPSEANSTLMTAQAAGRLVAIATALDLKESLLCCGGVCEGHQPDQM